MYCAGACRQAEIYRLRRVRFRARRFHTVANSQSFIRFKGKRGAYLSVYFPRFIGGAAYFRPNRRNVFGRDCRNGRGGGGVSKPPSSLYDRAPFRRAAIFQRTRQKKERRKRGTDFAQREYAKSHFATQSVQIPHPLFYGAGNLWTHTCPLRTSERRAFLRLPFRRKNRKGKT